jgi:hypothetical protein
MSPFCVFLLATVPNVGTDAQGNSVARGAIFDPLTYRQLSSGRWVGQMFPGNKIPVSRFSQVSQNLNGILQKYYLPTVKDASGLVPLTNNTSFPTSGQPIWDHYLYSVKVDHYLSSAHRLAGSANYARTPRLILDSGGLWSTSTPDPGGPQAVPRAGTWRRCWERAERALRGWMQWSRSIRCWISPARATARPATSGSSAGSAPKCRRPAAKRHP